MKLILSSCDFLNEKSKQTIIDNIDKPLNDNKVLFIPNEKYEESKINKYYDRLKRDGFDNKDNIYIFDYDNPDKYRNLNLDLIYIGGGNTFATLDKLRKSDFCKDVINYVKKGVIYIGGSCGALLATKNIKHIESLDNNYVGITDYDALNLTNILLIPHYDAEEYNRVERNRVYQELLKNNDNVYTLTNSQSLVITDNFIKKI